MPCWAFFDRQPATYRDEVLPRDVAARLSIEAGVTLGWQKYVGDRGGSIGVDRFGASAPGDVSVASAGISDDVRYPADVVRDNDGGLVRLFRGGDAVGDALYHGGVVIERPSLHVVFLGRPDAAAARRVMTSARALSGGLSALDGRRCVDPHTATCVNP